VLGESRARFEEQTPRRSRDEELDEDDDHGSSHNEPEYHRGDEELNEASDEASGDEASGEDRADRTDRQDRGERPHRNERFNRSSRPRGDERSADEAGRAERRPRVNGGDDSLPLDVLPPAIGREPQDEKVEASDDQPPRPRRRARNPRPADDDEIAPAA
jgi:hypothetical protein